MALAGKGGDSCENPTGILHQGMWEKLDLPQLRMEIEGMFDETAVKGGVLICWHYRASLYRIAW